MQMQAMKETVRERQQQLSAATLAERQQELKVTQRAEVRAFRLLPSCRLAPS